MIITKNSTEKYQCSAIVGNYQIVADNTPGKGGKGNGIRPHEILETAFASCLNMSVRMHCDRLNIPSDHISVTVFLDRKEEETVFNYSIEFGSEISESDKARVLQAVQSCPVRKTLSKQIIFVNYD